MHKPMHDLHLPRLSRDDLLPPEPAGMGRGLLLALAAHVLLMIAIAFGVHWNSSDPAGVEAELWSAVPQIAAQRSAPPEPEPEPAPPPKPEPRPVPKHVEAPPPPKPLPDPQIAIEKEKARQEKLKEEKRREEEKAEKAKREKAEQQKRKSSRKRSSKRRGWLRRRSRMPPRRGPTSCIEPRWNACASSSRAERATRRAVEHRPPTRAASSPQ